MKAKDIRAGDQWQDTISHSTWSWTATSDALYSEDNGYASFTIEYHDHPTLKTGTRAFPSDQELPFIVRPANETGH